MQSKLNQPHELNYFVLSVLFQPHHIEADGFRAYGCDTKIRSVILPKSRVKNEFITMN